VTGLVPRLRILTYNTHVGTTLRGAVPFLLEQERPDLVLLQEVQSRPARASARRLFLPHVWSSVGLLPLSRGRGSSGTLIFARRSVLERLRSSNLPLTPFHDPKHPERRLTTGQYRHRATGRVLDIGCVHLWTRVAGGTADPGVVLSNHRAQLQAYAASAREARRAGRLPFRIGDFNEHMTGSGGTPAEHAMATADLRPARPAHDDTSRIDEIFGPPELGYDGFRAIALPTNFAGVEGPHKALVVDVTVPQLAHAHAHPVRAGHGSGRRG
jgi:endonuclease/exonuclease/phosphatase family metal-dependent hydrolase